jgi:hypothetical protein
MSLHIMYEMYSHQGRIAQSVERWSYEPSVMSTILITSTNSFFNYIIVSCRVMSDDSVTK